MRRRVFLVTVLAVALLAQTLPAKGCTCVPEQDPREDLLRSDGAIIGTVLSRRPAEDDPQWTEVITFSVEEEVKGDFGDTLDVYSASDGAMCGLGAPEGARLGLLLRLDATTGRWWSGGCSVRDPERLREAAEPLPAPDGSGPSRLLAGGSWGEVGHLALDGRGRTLGYGVGDRRVVELVACPRGRAFLELYALGNGYAVAARRLRTNALLWEQDVTIQGEAPVGLGCSAGRPPGAYVATSTYLNADRASHGHVLQLGAGTRRVVYEGSLFDAAFGPRDRAFLQRDTGGRQVAELDLGSGSARFIARTPRGPAPLAVSPDGRRLATFAGGSLFVFDLPTGSKTRRELRGDTFGEAGWLGERTVGYFPRCGDNRGIEVFDAALETRRRVPGRWCASDSATAGRRAWGIFEGTVRKATIRGGVRVVARFPSKNLNVLAAVPGDRSIEWPEP